MLRGNGSLLLRIAESNDPMVSVTDACNVMGCTEQVLRLTAKQAPERLGFPVSIIGNRIKIPRVPFLRFLGVDV